MPSNERSHPTLTVDARTGRPTAISGPETGEAQRATCAAFNAVRAGGILEAAQSHASGEQVSADVWTGAFERTLSDREAPLIELSRLGFSYDADGFPHPVRF